MVDNVSQNNQTRKLDLLPSPTLQQEISIMMELGFMIDNYLIKRSVHLSNDLQLEADILQCLQTVAKITLSRAERLQKGEGCF